MYKYNDLTKTTKWLCAYTALLTVLFGGLLSAGCASTTPAQTGVAAADQGHVSELPHTPPPQTRRISDETLRNAVRNDTPLRYVVKPGDTLWDIARHFMVKPWYWPELWHDNRGIHNPHLIYPGQVLILTNVDRRPRIKLSPRVRERSVRKPIATIPPDAIKALLNAPHLVDAGQLANAPYVVALEDEHLIAGQGMTAFVRNLAADDPARLDIVRPGQPLIDPDTNEQIGMLAQAVGKLGITRRGDDVATAAITQSVLATRLGDRLLPARTRIEVSNFRLRAPQQPITGTIIATPTGNTILGQYDIVVINRGTQAHVQRGNLLQIYRAPRQVSDPVTNGTATLPEQRIGVLMLFDVNTRASLGIVLESTHAVHKRDRVRGAQP